MSLINLKNQDIDGYTHPTTTNYSKSKKYKTFTEGLKSVKDEKFGSVSVGNIYSSNNYISEEKCPICNNPPIKICNCANNDKTCSNEHIWYTDRSGQNKIGNTH